MREHELEKARTEALADVAAAQQQSDNYSLSVWWEVKLLLGKCTDEGRTAG